MMYSKQKIFCKCCGKEMIIEYSKMLGGKFLGYTVCSVDCVTEIRWRDVLSNLGKEYYPNPRTNEQTKS